MGLQGLFSTGHRMVLMGQNVCSKGSKVVPEVIQGIQDVIEIVCDLMLPMGQ